MDHTRSKRIWILVALLTFSIGVVATVWMKMRAPVRQIVEPMPKLIIPKASWEPIFFEQINATAGLTGQANLRQTELSTGDIETRIWWGFGLTPLEGISLRYRSGQWSAIHVKADNYYEPTKASSEELKPPKSGWDATWSRLVQAGILTLPDASEINCGGISLDGIAFVVETNVDGTYRTYKYSNPSLKDCEQAGQVQEIFDTLLEEFSWTRREDR